MNNMFFKYTFILFILLFVGCQSKLEMIGQEHAKEVLKWQELARFAGNELKYLGLTVTAGVQINQKPEGTSYSIVKVQLNRDANHTEIDLLSPELAEKFACGEECQKLGLYDSNFAKQETQLSSFFFNEEGRFFEFYGRLTRLNAALADYRASSPDILKEYLTLMLNRKLTFNSLLEFVSHLETHVTEEKLLAFSTSGLISPVEDRLSATFMDDLIANLPKNWQISDEQTDTLQTDTLQMPSNNWSTDVSTPDELLFETLISKVTSANTIAENWEQAKQYEVQVGSIVCSFSDNIFGVVKGLETNNVSVNVIAQARVIVDGMNLYQQSGHLFTTAESFYFVKGSFNETYPLSDVAACNIEHLKRGQNLTKN
jgi:hypothetical protein